MGVECAGGWLRDWVGALVVFAGVFAFRAGALDQGAAVRTVSWLVAEMTTRPIFFVLNSTKALRTPYHPMGTCRLQFYLADLIADLCSRLWSQMRCNQRHNCRCWAELA